MYVKKAIACFDGRFRVCLGRNGHYSDNHNGTLKTTINIFICWYLGSENYSHVHTVGVHSLDQKISPDNGIELTI